MGCGAARAKRPRSGGTRREVRLAMLQRVLLLGVFLFSCCDTCGNVASADRIGGRENKTRENGGHLARSATQPYGLLCSLPRDSGLATRLVVATRTVVLRRGRPCRLCARIPDKHVSNLFAFTR